MEITGSGTAAFQSFSFPFPLLPAYGFNGVAECIVLYSFPLHLVFSFASVLTLPSASANVKGRSVFLAVSWEDELYFD